jgi:fatty acid synthase
MLITIGSVKFLVNIFDGTGDFELSEGGSVVVSGRILVPEDVEKEQLDLPAPVQPDEPELLPLKTSDVYKDLRLRGYDYGGIFRGIAECDNRGIFLIIHKASFIINCLIDSKQNIDVLYRNCCR